MTELRTRAGAPIRLRPIHPEDVPFLAEVYASTRTEELARVPWAPGQKEAFLAQQFTAQHAYYQENYPEAEFQIVLVNENRAGRLYLAEWPREFRIVDISLLPGYRGKGVGTRLLEEVIRRANAAGKPVSIHVEVFNPARALYARLGFSQAEDRGVYLLMERPAQPLVPAAPVR